MRTPIRSEPEAFRLALGVAAAIGGSLLIGWLTEPLVGVLVFAAAAVVALVAYVRAPNPDRRTAIRDASRERHPHAAARGTKHVLVIANDTLRGDDVRALIMGDDSQRVEIDVLAPVLVSRTRLAVSDIDRGLDEARTRLERSLAWAREQGIAARGEVGDPSIGTGIEDELRDSGADEVIVVARQAERQTWQERGELERLRRELDVPVRLIGASGGDGG
jgi:hypothetical protein